MFDYPELSVAEQDRAKASTQHQPEQNNDVAACFDVDDAVCCVVL